MVKIHLNLTEKPLNIHYKEPQVNTVTEITAKKNYRKPNANIYLFLNYFNNISF